MIEILRACTYTCMQLGVILIVCDTETEIINYNGTFSKRESQGRKWKEEGL